MKLLFFSCLILVSFGCNTSTSEVDTNKDSIIGLQEERIKQLEQQLKNAPVAPSDTFKSLETNNNQSEADVQAYTYDKKESEFILKMKPNMVLDGFQMYSIRNTLEQLQSTIKTLKLLLVMQATHLDISSII